MASNAGKRLELLKKQLAELQAKEKGFHFVVIQPGETESERVEALESAGTISPGDEYQPVHIPWLVNPLTGSKHIPEGNPDDPYADPRERNSASGSMDGIHGMGVVERGNIGATASGTTLDPLPTHEQQERWKRHEAEISRSGQRYEGPKQGYDA
jgi:hypothetical protein